MLAIVVLFQLSFLTGALEGKGLRFSEDPTAFAVFKGWNAKTIGTLEFHFKTKSENGFLIYEDDRGQCQYMYLSLVEGRLRLRLKMGDCEETQTILVGHSLADDKWHKATVQRNHSVTTVTVDGEFTNTTHYRGYRKRFFKASSDLLVGRIPWYTRFNDLSFPAIYYESIKVNRFKGCISGVKYSSFRGPLKEAPLKNTSGTTQDCVNPCSRGDQCMNGGVCRDSIEEGCDCKGTGYEGPNCTEEVASVWLSGSGYIIFYMDPLEEKPHLNISYVAFGLRTNASNGIILNLQSNSANDYLLIEMVHGKIRVEVDLGQGEYVLEGTEAMVDDGEWHWVEFNRRGRAVTLKIDGNILSDGEIHGKLFQLNADGSNPKLYVAGGPRDVFIKSVSKMNFTGELREFYFRNMKLLDHVVPTTTDKRFKTIGTVIDGSTIPETSGSGCDLMDDDEDSICWEVTSERPKENVVSSSPKPDPTSDSGLLPTGVQAHRSLPQVVPFWVIPVLVVVAAIAIFVTMFFLYRWNSRYSGSFKPEPASSSGDLPQISKPRICVSAHEEKA